MGKIAACIICRDSKDTIESCLKSLKGAIDFLSITDTGSLDNTKEIVEKTCHEIGLEYKLTDFEWCDDFAAARNFSFAHVPADCDFLSWLDSDDELINGSELHDIANKLPAEFGAVWFPYNYARDEMGNCSTLYERERLLRASCGWVWKGRLHETVEPLAQTKFCRSDKVHLRHNHLAGAPRHDRNLRILNIMHQDEPENRRVWLYFGHQYFAHQDWLDAAEWYVKFASDPQPVPLEKFQALCYASKALREARDYQQAVQVALMAVELQPQFIDGYLELAHSYNALGDPDKGLHWVHLSEDKILVQPPALIFLNPMDYTYNKWCLQADLYFKKGDTTKALEYLRQAMNMRPIPDVKAKVVELQEIKNRQDIADGLKRLCVDLLNKGEIGKLSAVLEAVPYWFKDLPDYKEMQAGIQHHVQALPRAYSSEGNVTTQGLIWNTVSARLQEFPKASVLIVGCGEGSFVRLLAEIGVAAYGFESDPDKARIAMQLLPGRCKEGKIGNHKKRYDIVVSMNELEFKENPTQYLEMLEKVGQRVIITANVPKPMMPGKPRYRVLGQTDLEELIVSKPNRHVVNLHRLSHPEAEEDIMFCEYDKKVPSNKFIKLFLGSGPEYWNPYTIKHVGCGGSETSAAYVARELAKDSCFPIIYARDNQIWDSVLYRPWEQTNLQTPCHLFISSRIPDIFDNEIKAEQRWLWVHDVHCGDRFTPARASQLDVVWLLSEWHVSFWKRVYPWLAKAEVIDMMPSEATFIDDNADMNPFTGDPPENLPVIMKLGDAIDTSRFKDLEETRIPYRFIWVSSPDRGLEELLRFWPRIRELYNTAELHIFYGWEYFDTSLFIPTQREFKARIKKLLEQPGIHWRGRVGQLQLAHEMALSDAWIYPPHGFRETCCISAIELQATGVLCFYRENGALGETIGKRGIPITNENLLTNLGLLKDREKCDTLRRTAREWAMQRDWAVVAQKVQEMYALIEQRKAGAKAGCLQRGSP